MPVSTCIASCSGQNQNTANLSIASCTHILTLALSSNHGVGAILPTPHLLLTPFPPSLKAHKSQPASRSSTHIRFHTCTKPCAKPNPHMLFRSNARHSCMRDLAKRRLRLSTLSRNHPLASPLAAFKAQKNRRTSKKSPALFHPLMHMQRKERTAKNRKRKNGKRAGKKDRKKNGKKGGKKTETHLVSRAKARRS